METIKITIQMVMTTGSTIPCTFRNPDTGNKTTGCTSIDNCECYYIIPDTGVTHNLKILLKSKQIDLGFFDVDTTITGATGLTGLSDTTYVVTGECTSRLTELKKFKSGTEFTSEYYRGGGDWNNDGVDFNLSNPETEIIYYVGSIRYIDDIVNQITHFEFISLGYSSPNFINLPYFKDPAKESIVSAPKIDEDVFIIRQELSAFENNYKLEHINNLGELSTYAGGGLFNIVNNT